MQEAAQMFKEACCILEQHVVGQRELHLERFKAFRPSASVYCQKCSNFMKLPVFWSVLLCSVMFCGCTENCAPVDHIYHISSLVRSWPVQMQALLQECLNSCCQHTGNSLDVDGVSLNLRPVLRWIFPFLLMQFVLSSYSGSCNVVTTFAQSKGIVMVGLFNKQDCGLRVFSN